MPQKSRALDLLKAAKLIAVSENDSLLVYLIDMAILRAKDHKNSQSSVG
jgi:hypothetical protein